MKMNIKTTMESNVRLSFHEEHFQKIPFQRMQKRMKMLDFLISLGIIRRKISNNDEMSHPHCSL